jgi:hypothetical protein
MALSIRRKRQRFAVEKHLWWRVKALSLGVNKATLAERRSKSTLGPNVPDAEVVSELGPEKVIPNSQNKRAVPLSVILALSSKAWLARPAVFLAKVSLRSLSPKNGTAQLLTHQSPISRADKTAIAVSSYPSDFVQYVYSVFHAPHLGLTSRALSL